jgi:hypothetical protein
MELIGGCGAVPICSHIIDKALNGLIFNTYDRGFMGGRLEWGPYNDDSKGYRPFGEYP